VLPNPVCGTRESNEKITLDNCEAQMILETVIAVFALAVAIGGLGLWSWIDMVTLPRNPGRYLRYSLIGGILVWVACFASFVALVVPQSGQRLLGMGIVLSLLVGLIVGIGMASPYWVTEKLNNWITGKLKEKERTDITGGNNHV